MTIHDYINIKYNGRQNWFVDEVSSFYNQSRISRVLDIKEYLTGKHKILNRAVETWNGREFYPRTIILQYAKTILNFETSYLLKNPVTLTGDESTVNEFKEVYKHGKYNRIDFDLLDAMCKYGQVFEYVYLDGGVIKSRIINAEDGYSVINEFNEMIAFIEFWTTDDGISYYIIYYPDIVEKWSDEGGELKLIGVYDNLSGLPIVYKNRNEMDNTTGRSDLEDWINIIDHMEDLISKYTDSIYKFINPLPVVIGQKLAIGKNGEGGVSQHLVGNGLNLDDGSDFKFASGQLDYRSFESVYKMLKQALLDVSCTPAVSLNNQDVSNLSEVSIKLLFSLADIKAGLNERYMREGFEKRFKQIGKLLAMQGREVNADNIDVVFQYARPQNEKDIIDNLKVLNDMSSISLQTILENSPFVNDVAQELDRLSNTETKKSNTDY